MYPHILFPFRVATPDPSPSIKKFCDDVIPVIKVPVDSGIVPTRLLFVRIIEVSAPAVLNVNPVNVL
jgi:hypothetical protein